MAYFDNAATTLIKPPEVLEAMNIAMHELNVNYGRSQHALSSKAYSLVDETRGLIQQVVGAYSKDVVFIPTATEALNLLIRGAHIQHKSGGASSLKVGDVIYISPFEHNAVTRTVEFLKQKRGVEVKVLNLLNYQEQFAEVAPQMVVMTQASNVTGEVLPAREICTTAKQVTSGKCVTIVDMAQTAGKAVSGTVGNLETVDAVVFSGHKSLYAPFGASGMLIKRGLQIDPLIFGGTGLDSANQQMPDQIPERFEVGSMNIIALAGLNAACKWRLANAEEVATRELNNDQKLVQVLESADFEMLKWLGNLRNGGADANIGNELPEDNGQVLTTGVVSVLPPDGFGVDQFGIWLSERNVQVRTGLHCAPTAHQTLGTSPAGTVRFSVSYFTSTDDFEVLKQALKTIGGR